MTDIQCGTECVSISDKADLAVNSAENINSRFLCVTDPQVQQYSSYQGGRMGQGKEVVASFR